MPDTKSDYLFLTPLVSVQILFCNAMAIIDSLSSELLVPMSLIPPGQSSSEADLVQEARREDHESRRSTEPPRTSGDPDWRNETTEGYDHRILSQSGTGSPPADIVAILVSPSDTLGGLGGSESHRFNKV